MMHTLTFMHKSKLRSKPHNIGFHKLYNSIVMAARAYKLYNSVSHILYKQHCYTFIELVMHLVYCYKLDNDDCS